MFFGTLACGLNWFDAIVHTFGAAGTGGFSNYADSVGHFSAPVQTLIGVFCMIFGVNFAMYYALIRRDFKAIWKNGEWKLYFAIILVATGLIALNIFPQCGRNLSGHTAGLFPGILHHHHHRLRHREFRSLAPAFPGWYWCF